MVASKQYRRLLGLRPALLAATLREVLRRHQVRETDSPFCVWHRARVESAFSTVRSDSRCLVLAGAAREVLAYSVDAQGPSRRQATQQRRRGTRSPRR
jgi:hypothetical protein